MNNTIAELLYMTPAQLNDLHLSIYMEWSGKMAKELGYEHQSIAANTAISKWFSVEFGILEQQAFKTLRPTYGEINQDKARTIYGSITAEVYRNYPKPLLDAAQKITIINEPHDYNAN